MKILEKAKKKKDQGTCVVVTYLLKQGITYNDLQWPTMTHNDLQ